MIYDWPDFFEERAAIIEFEAKKSRFIADKKAYIETIKAYQLQNNCTHTQAQADLAKMNITNPRVKDYERIT